MSKTSGAIPISLENLELIRKKQFELSKKEGKILKLTEVSNEIVKKGLKYMNDEKFLDMEFEVV